MARKSGQDFDLRRDVATGILRILRTRKDPIVQWPRTPPFHGGNTGSNPVRVACIHEGFQAILELA